LTMETLILFFFLRAFFAGFFVEVRNF
jgi:hypothetical protein